MMKIQELIIRCFFAPLAVLVNRMGEKAKNCGFILSGLGLFFISFLYGSERYTNVRYLLFFGAGCLFLGLMVLFSLKKELKPIKFDGVLTVVWLLIGVLIGISGLRFKLDYLSEAIIFLAAAPVFFVVWGNLDHSRLMARLSLTCKISFVAYLAVSILFFPVSGVRVTSLIFNPNGTAIYLALVFICLLVDVLNRRKFCMGMVLEVALLGISGALIYYSASRTGLLASLLGAGLTVILYLIRHAGQLRRRLLLNVLPIILSIGIFFPTTIYLMQATAVVQKAVHQVVVMMLPEKENTEAEIPDQEGDKIPDIQSLDKYVTEVEHRLDTDGKSLAQISTGRIDIWKTWLRNLKLFGNGAEERFYIERVGRYYQNAHMTILTIGYRSGIICGLLYLLFNILAGLKSVQFALKNRDSDYALMPFAVTIVFGVISVLTSVNTPFTMMITMYYYFVQTPLMQHVTWKRSLPEGENNE